MNQYKIRSKTTNEIFEIDAETSEEAIEEFLNQVLDNTTDDQLMHVGSMTLMNTVYDDIELIPNPKELN